MGHEQRADDIKNRDARRTSSTSGSIFTFGSMLRTRSWIDRRMLASPGVDLRLEEVSSVAHVSSLGFFNADGVPKNKPQAHVSHSPTTNLAIREKENAPAMRPAVMPPVSVGRLAAAVGHEMGPGFVVFSVWLIGYVSFELEPSPRI